MISVPQSRRQAFFTTAKASGKISSSRRASSSLSSILESSSFHAAVFCAERFFGQLLQLGFELVDLRDHRAQALDLALILRADKLF